MFRYQLEKELNNREQKIKELVDAQIQLKEQEAIAQTASQLAHDINSPLSVIKLVFEELKITSGTVLKMFNQSIERIEAATASLQLKRKQLSLSKQVISPLQSVGQLYTEKQVEFKKLEGLDLRLNADQISKNDTIVFDSNSLKRIISNLVNNAVEALPQNKGIVTLELQADSDFVSLSVCDNGKGIAPKLIPLLMREGNSFGKDNGMGLGLFHAKQVVEGYGGEISVSSEVGRGTKVMLKFPNVSSELTRPV